MKYLNRHPSETDLTLDQIAEVAMIGQEIEKQQVEMLGALFGSR